MQRTLIFLCLVLGLSFSQAQTLYAGVSASLLTDGRYSSPLIGIQLGAELAENLELRAAFETQIHASSLAADLLYRVPLEHSLSTYLGAGSDILLVPLLQPTSHRCKHWAHQATHFTGRWGSSFAPTILAFLAKCSLRFPSLRFNGILRGFAPE